MRVCQKCNVELLPILDPFRCTDGMPDENGDIWLGCYCGPCHFLLLKEGKCDGKHEGPRT